MKKILLSAIVSIVSVVNADTLHIYSARHYDADQKLYELFEQKTGITIKATQAKAEELIKKMQIEGDKTPADIFITADISNLNQAKDLGLLATTNSKYVNETVPAHLRDSDGTWIAITKRARIIAYDKTKTKPEISTYEELADPKFKGKILMRSATNAYSKTLLASIVQNNGAKEAKKWAAGVLANLAQPPKGGDRDQAKAMIAGAGEYAIMNTYYIGLMLNSANAKDVEVAKKIGIIFPNQNDRGTHINISGASVTKASKHKENAVKFIEFLLTPQAQEILTNINYEYPVNKEVKPSKTMANFGEFKEDTISLSKVASKVKEATIIYDEVGFR